MTKNFCLLIIALLLSHYPSFSQSPYSLNLKKELLYLGTGSALLGSGLYLASEVNGLTTEEAFELDRLSINGIDRLATLNYSSSAKSQSDRLLFGSHALPALLLIPKDTRKDMGKILLLYAEVHTITTGLTFISKSLILRPRPLVYNESVEEAIKLDKGARFAFFSGHTSVVAANSFFVAKVFSDYYPDSKLKPIVWGIAATIPAVTGILRIEAGKHYPTDVMIGYGVGALVGVLVPHFHKRKANQKPSPISVYPGINGGMITWDF